jgi:hypothetical protein
MIHCSAFYSTADGLCAVLSPLLLNWICVSAHIDNIVHHQVHRDIRGSRGDEHEECSLLDVMFSGLVMVPIIRAGRSKNWNGSLLRNIG